MNKQQWLALVVDDEQDSLNVVAKILQHEGMRVIVAHSGQECLDILEEIQPTLIVMDLAMPEMDGWQTLAAIRANPATASLPVLAITAYDSEVVAEAITTAGFDGYFPKPIRPGLFVSHLTNIAS